MRFPQRCGGRTGWGPEDGVQDPGEPGIPGVTRTLERVTGGGGTWTTVTGPDGAFAFAGLGIGTYTLTETQPSGYTSGTNRNNGSIGTVSGDTITGIVVGGSSPTNSYSFAEVPTAGIWGFVYHDLNANGTRDAGEPGIAGVTVEVQGDGNATVTTASDGSYRIDGLTPGNYSVHETQPAGWMDGRDEAGTGPGFPLDAPGADVIMSVTLGAGERLTGYNFGEVHAASIAGVVYGENDGDGVKETGEPGIAPVTVELFGTSMFNTAEYFSVTTNADGTFLFDNLIPGTYDVVETQPGGIFSYDGPDYAGTAGGTVGNDYVQDIALGSGTTGTNYRFTELIAVTLSGIAFEDIDGDGVQDAGEDGIPGANLELLDENGDPVFSATSTAGGAWSFTNLHPGVYSVRITTPGGYVASIATAGTAGGAATPTEIGPMTLTANADGYRFGFIPLSIIQGIVWHDQDGDGAYDAGEPLLSGVQVALSGTASRTTTTGPDGRFVFGDLPAGTYTITETQPSGWFDGVTLVGPAGGTAGVNTVTGITIGAGDNATGYGFAELAADLQLTVRAQSDDAQLDPGPYVAVGDDVRLIYTVTNNGDTALDNIEVVDDVLGPIVCPSDTLVAGDSMDCELDTPAVAGQQVHNGSVTANVVPATVGGAAPQLSATDPAHYFGMVATAALAFDIDGDAAATSPGPVLPMGVHTITVTITNTGNVPLEFDSIDGGTLTGFDCGPVVTIPVGGSIDCTLTIDPSPGNYAIPISATLTGPDGVTVTGTPVATGASPAGTLFFQINAPGVPLPNEVAMTGHEIGWAPLLVVTLMLLLGSALVVMGRRRTPLVATA